MNFRIVHSWAFLLFAVIIFSACEKEIIQHDIEEEIQQLVTTNNLPSLSACIIKNDEIVWSITYGYSNLEDGTEADEETIYHIGSISKLFVITAIMQLEEQGKIDLDNDINNYLPIMLRHPSYADIPITTRMLLIHTAGLSSPQTYDGEKGMWNQFEPDQGPPPSEWVPQFLIPTGVYYDHNLWNSAEPGTYEFYSNIGFCVAAYIVEQISGENFRDYCKDHIFAPLNMHSSSYNYSDLDWNKIAIMYSRQQVGSNYFDNRIYASGGAKSTIQDLSRFASCYMNKGILDDHRILNENSINKILEIQNQASGRCLAWEEYLGEWFGHTGGIVRGAATTIFINPESRAGIIIFTNSHSGLVTPGGDIFWLVKQKANKYIK